MRLKTFRWLRSLGQALTRGPQSRSPLHAWSWIAILAGTAWREASGGCLGLDGPFAFTFLGIAAPHSAWDLSQGVMSLALMPVLVGIDILFLRRLILSAHRQ